MQKKELYSKIYEDDKILVINKPAGLLTIPDRYDKKAPNLRHILDEEYGHIFVVHRLDRDTSGVMVFAKDADSHRDLNFQFESLFVKKIYHVVTDGVIHQDDLEIDIPLAPDPRKPGRTIPSARGKESLTLLHVRERYRHATFAEINLVTGRHHQIRVHCAAVGHPLLVDDFYGNYTEFLVSSIKKRFNLKKNDVEKPLISRITMHAFSIGFKHPETKEEMSFEAPYPKDFAALLQAMGKYSKTR
jgi:RluA family pseudouridine synthase